MADPFVAVEVQGLAELQAKLKQLPIEAQDMVVDDLNKYYLNVFRGYPPKNYVTRKAAYGVTFFTEKQRRWFFANLNEGNIDVPYVRTQQLSKGWRQVGSGRTSFLANERAGAPYVVGDDQSRHEAMVGWKKAVDVIKERMSKALQVADGAVKKAIRKLHLD